MKLKFAFMLLIALIFSNNNIFCGDLKWFVTQYNGDDEKPRISRNGDYIIIGEHSASMELLNPRNGMLVSAIASESIKSFRINWDFSIDNDIFYVMCDESMHFFNPKTAELIKEYEYVENGNQYTFKCIAKPKEQNFFVGLGYNNAEPKKNKLITWDADSFKIINSFDINIDSFTVYSFDVSDDGALLCIRLKKLDNYSNYSTKNLIYD